MYTRTSLWIVRSLIHHHLHLSNENRLGSDSDRRLRHLISFPFPLSKMVFQYQPPGDSDCWVQEALALMWLVSPAVLILKMGNFRRPNLYSCVTFPHIYWPFSVPRKTKTILNVRSDPWCWKEHILILNIIQRKCEKWFPNLQTPHWTYALKTVVQYLPWNT